MEYPIGHQYWYVAQLVCFIQHWWVVFIIFDLNLFWQICTSVVKPNLQNWNIWISSILLLYPLNIFNFVMVSVRNIDFWHSCSLFIFQNFSTCVPEVCWLYLFCQIHFDKVLSWSWYYIYEQNYIYEQEYTRFRINNIRWTSELTLYWPIRIICVWTYLE